MLNKKEFIEQIFNEIEEESNNQLKIINKVFGNGYYVFEFGENSVCHFKIKGLKRWQFGLWIREDNENYVVDLFGEHEDYIDKFKPTATKIKYEFKCKNENDLWQCDDFINELMRIKQHPYVIKHCYYDIFENYLIFLLSEFFYYRIKIHLIKFKKYSLTKLYLNCIKIIYKLRFKKLDINVYDKRETGWNVYPPFDFNIYYDKCIEDELYNIYSSIEGKEKTWLIPKWVRYNIHVNHLRNKNDKHGFYFKNIE